MCSKAFPALFHWQCRIELEYHMARNQNPRVQAVPFSYLQSCIPWHSPFSLGFGSRPSSGFSGLFLSPSHVATTRPSPLPRSPVVKASLTIMTINTGRALCSFQRSQVNLVVICEDRINPFFVMRKLRPMRS